MTFYTFHRLSPSKQYEAVFEQGNFLRACADPEAQTALVLYSLSNFWVELHYYLQKDILTGLRAFTLSQNPRLTNV